MRLLRHSAVRWTLAILAVLLLAVAILAKNAGSFLIREIERRSDGRVLVSDVSIATGSLTLHDVVVTDGGFSLRCLEIEAPLVLSSDPLPLPSVRLEDCSFAERSPTADAEPSTGPEPTERVQGVRDSLDRALARARGFADEVEVVRLSLATDSRGGGYVESAHLDLAAAGPRLQLTDFRFAAPEGAIAVAEATVELATDGSVSLVSDAPVAIADWRARCGSLRMPPTFDRAECTDLELQHAGGWVELELASVTVRHDDGWALSAQTGTLDLMPVAEGAAVEDHQRLVRSVLDRLAGRFGVEIAAGASATDVEAEASGTAAGMEEATSPGVMACLEGADCWSPSPIAGVLNRALDRLERWPEMRDRLLALERPETRLDVEGLGVTLGGMSVARIERLSLHGDQFELDAGTGDVEFEVSTDLSSLSRIELSASGLDLAAAGAWIDPELTTRGRMSVRGSVAFDGSTLRAAMELAFDEWGFGWDAVSPEDIAFEPASVAVEVVMGSVPVGAAEGELERRVSAEASVVYGDLRVGTSVTLAEAAADDWTLQWRAELAEEVSCSRLWRAIPAGLLPTLGHRGVRFEGETGWVLSVSYRFGDPWSFEPESELFPGTCRVAWVTPEFDPEQLNSEFYVHHVTEGVEREDILVGPGTPSWVRLETLPAYVPAAMYLSEEMNFYNGVGISLNLIRRAVALNIHRSRYAYGGSTVMQQLVKNLFLSRAKTLSRKLEEAILVWAMLERVEKDRILELYINCIEFAPDVYGIAAASEHYFGKPPQWLTPLEAIYLANLKPSPASAVNHYRRGHSPTRGWWQDRTRVMLQRLLQHTGSIHPDEVDYYAPYIVALTGSPAWESSGYQPIERPDWAVLGGIAEPVPEPTAKP